MYDEYMSMHLRRLDLFNYKGFKNKSFEFDGPEDSGVNILYGPMGLGKSSILQAASIASSPKIFASRARDPSFYIRSLIRNDDYSSDAVHLQSMREMQIHAEFEHESNSYTMIISNNGFIKNDLENYPRISSMIDADSPTNYNKFQIKEDLQDDFLNFAGPIYKKPIELCSLYDGFYSDMILHKGEVNVHYSSMSAGEKKIATIIRNVITDISFGRSIFLIDNLDIHLYFEDQPDMLKKIQEFSNRGKQFLITAHSETMIRTAKEMNMRLIRMSEN